MKATSKEMAAGGDLFQAVERLHATLSETHFSIPQLIADELSLSKRVGLAEVRGGNNADLLKQLEAVRKEHERAQGRRAAAGDALIECEAELLVERDRIEERKRERLMAIIEDVRERCAAQCAELQLTWAELGEYEQELHTPIEVPEPMRIRPNYNGEPRLERKPGDRPPKLDAEYMQLKEQLKPVNRYLSVIAAVKSAHEQDRNCFQVAARRMEPLPSRGVYRILRPSRCPLDLMDFTPGQLVDGALMGYGHLANLIKALRFVELVQLTLPAAGAAA
jgi:hypothetical protein